MQVENTLIADVKILTPKVFSDARGFFMEVWRDEFFKQNIENCNFVQENHSKSTKGVLRGLHYQLQHTQGKLVRVVTGEVLDVAVDLRKSSPSFGKYVSVILSAENKKQLWIPKGFAHGFYVISPIAELVYKCTDIYHPASEQTLIYNDATIKINWGIKGEPIISEKDLQGKNWQQAIKFE